MIEKSKPIDTQLSNPENFLAGIPHHILAPLRKNNPVIWSTDAFGNGFWSITKYDDIVAVNRNAEVFSSAEGIMAFPGTTLGPGKPTMLMEMDDPEHLLNRKLINRAFTLKQINQLEPSMRKVCRETIDSVKYLGRCDFVHDIAAAVPMRVITQLIGNPVEDEDYLVALSDRVNAVGDTGPVMDAIEEVFQYARAIAKLKSRSAPTTEKDMSDILLSADIDGQKLSDIEYELFFLLLLVAGNETTRTAISNGILGFINNPSQWKMLQSDPSLMESAIEEVLRWSTPALYMARTATRDTKIGDQKVAAGEKVVMWYCSAHFDEDAIQDPMKFDITRKPGKQISFGGGGIHYCLGANLALLELRVLLEELLSTFKQFELDGTTSYLRSNFSNAIVTLPIKFELL
ncbi:MAG: cytochrome P450 [Halieaceae bacterium]|nr:cytochrome P450 [Halieaceae bacterium]